MVWVDAYFPCYQVAAATAAAATPEGGGTWRPVFARTGGKHHEAWLMVVEKAHLGLGLGLGIGLGVGVE